MLQISELCEVAVNIKHREFCHICLRKIEKASKFKEATNFKPPQILMCCECAILFLPLPYFFPLLSFLFYPRF